MFTSSYEYRLIAMSFATRPVARPRHRNLCELRRCDLIRDLIRATELGRRACGGGTGAVLDANVMPGGWGAGPTSAPGPTISKLPLGGMIGRESEGAVQRVGFRTSLIPRSPVAG
jgi:hypothetical protein